MFIDARRQNDCNDRTRECLDAVYQFDNTLDRCTFMHRDNEFKNRLSNKQDVRKTQAGIIDLSEFFIRVVHVALFSRLSGSCKGPKKV